MKIAVVGLGYVGLPLAMALSQKFTVVGYDIDEQRVAELNEGLDSTHEFSSAEIQEARISLITNDEQVLQDCVAFIVTVPTPVTKDNTPDLSYLLAASATIGKYLKREDVVVYESTVYPGCTEEDCAPVLERVSGLQADKDFYLGYSPERINPGDKSKPLASIQKIVASKTSEGRAVIKYVYESIITAGIYEAPSIKVAEAAKAVENAQRDINISFMNELALMFHKMNIDVHEVLKAAATKWNFIPFKPGLVGGHCIGVDPHYLAWKAIQVGYTPKVILSGREVNEQMGIFLAEKMIAALAQKFEGGIKAKRVLILGFAFKPNCADTRNTKVIDVYHSLVKAGLLVDVYDPLVDAKQVSVGFGLQLIAQPLYPYDGIVLAVPHHTLLKSEATNLKEAEIVVNI